MDLPEYEGKYVRVTDTLGNIFTGRVSYGISEFLMHEYGGDEDGIFVGDYLIYRSRIESIEEIEVHGTAELWTDQLILRRYHEEDAEPLYQYMGTDPALISNRHLPRAFIRNSLRRQAIRKCPAP